MVNSQAFSERLEKVIDYYGLNASTFAEKVDVGRSSISHIMSGRNKPSLEFVLKVIETFEEVDLYWLLNGKGVFPKSDEKIPSTHTSHKDVTEVKNKIDELPFPEIKEPQTSQPHQKTLERIILLYTDGSFKSYLAS